MNDDHPKDQRDTHTAAGHSKPDRADTEPERKTALLGSNDEDSIRAYDADYTAQKEA